MNSINIQCESIRQNTFQLWVKHYYDHLINLHEMTDLSFDEFTQLAYQCTLPIYDYKCKQYKRYLI